MRLDITMGGAIILAFVWLVFAAVVFGVALSFISAKIKNQSAAFGLGTTVFLAGAMSDYLGRNIRKILWPIADFNFGSLSVFNSVFGGDKMYNLFGMPVSYGVMASIVGVSLTVIAVLLTYMAQKKRTAG